MPTLPAGTTRMYTQAKSFSNATLATAISAANTFITGTLDVDTDNNFSTVFLLPVWDGTNWNVTIQYTYFAIPVPV